MSGCRRFGGGARHGRRSVGHCCLLAARDGDQGIARARWWRACASVDGCARRSAAAARRVACACACCDRQYRVLVSATRYVIARWLCLSAQLVVIPLRLRERLIKNRFSQVRHRAPSSGKLVTGSRQYIVARLGHSAPRS